jgi:integrase/recombinase XerC
MQGGIRHCDYFLTLDQCNKIMLCAKTLRDKLIIKLLWKTGMRREEICNIDISDVRFESKLIRVKGKRTKANQTGEGLVPVTQDILQDFTHIISTRRDGPVFLVKDKTGERRISTRAINYIVETAAIRADVKNPEDPNKNVHPHLFRHSFAHNYRNSIGLENVSQILRHSDFRFTLDRYGKGIKKAQEEYDKVMEK